MGRLATKTGLAAYRGRRVGVIGLGFLGWNLSRRLLELGARTSVLCHHTPSTLMTRYQNIGDLQCRVGDIRHFKPVQDFIREQEVVFNLAGHSGALASSAYPVTDLEVNCRGALNVLRAAECDGGRPRVVFIGSRLQYGRPLRLPVDEEHPQNPGTVYGIHKMVGEAYHRVYRQTHGLETVVLRLTNPYGFAPVRPRSGYNVFNAFIETAVRRGVIRIFSPGVQLRDYVYVEDVVEALLLAGGRSAAVGGAFNIGAGIGVRLVDAAHLVTETVGRGTVELVPWPRDYKVVESGDFVASVAKARRVLGWEARTNLQEGIKRAAAGYERFAMGGEVL